VVGHVPELAFEKLTDQPILLRDGEELPDAKENQGLSISPLVIQVSCVEMGSSKP